MLTKKNVLNLVASGLIIVVGIFITKNILTTAPKAQKQQREAIGTIVETLSITPSSEAIILSSIGFVEASQKTTLNSKVAGKIIQTSPHFMIGGFVKKDEMLALIDKTDYEGALNQAHAQLLSAKASYQIELGQQESAKKELEISKIAPTQLSKSLILREPQLEQVKASILNYEATYAIAQNNLKETAIKAPYDGVILKKSAEIGTFVTTQSTIAELVATDEFWINITLPLSSLKFLSDLKESELAKLEVALFNNTTPLHVEAKIIKLLPELDVSTKQAQVIIAIKDPLGVANKKEQLHKVLLGETLRVTVKSKTYDNVFALPTFLLRPNNTIWVMNEKNQLTIKPVEVLHKNADHILITSGISPSDKIITTYLSTPVEGMALVTLSMLNKKPKGE